MFAQLSVFYMQPMLHTPHAYAGTLTIAGLYISSYHVIHAVAFKDRVQRIFDQPVQFQDVDPPFRPEPVLGYPRFR